MKHFSLLAQKITEFKPTSPPPGIQRPWKLENILSSLAGTKSKIRLLSSIKADKKLS